MSNSNSHQTRYKNKFAKIQIVKQHLKIWEMFYQYYGHTESYIFVSSRMELYTSM